MNGRGGPIDVRPRVAAAAAEEEEEEDHTARALLEYRIQAEALRAEHRIQAEALRAEHRRREEALRVEHLRQEEALTARALLTEDGFDRNDFNQRDRGGRTPMTYYCRRGNVTMVRYLIARGVDCQRADRYGQFPMYEAAMNGHLEIITLLSQVGGAHEDIRKLTGYGYSPLQGALKYNQVDVWKWLILKEVLAPRNDMDDGGIDDATMRRDLSPTYSNSRIWDSDRRETVQAWAQDTITNHDTVVTLLLTGMIDSASTLVVFDGTSGILEVIAQYMAEKTPQQVRMLRQLLVLLRAFIDDTPFRTDDE